MREVFVALGSNVDPGARMQQAARLLRERFPDTRFSGCYRNPAFGFDGDDFLNAVAGFSTDLLVPALLQVLHGIEAQCGRARDDPKWGPRAMDLDLLLYGDQVGEGPGYTLPRRDLLRRVYMLGPLAELAPQVRHPISGETIGALWAAFAQSEHTLRASAPDLNAA
ncbi:MAG TPA: 2-amino-4-hydroxy-6-hydroxymethyldihydropteridine diphosphokinase [Steroidobacteraceae bacterium]|jgi:2-amino-4-hydroxy-6-hydroxymethyldihydropteridine diphosphokinase